MAAEPLFATNIATKGNFKVYISIDFGTDGVASAYSLPNTEEVYVHSGWANIKFEPKDKTKAIILLDEKYNKISFGADAKLKYMMMPEMNDKWFLFERFKMSLYNNDGMESECKDNDEKINIKDKLIAANGKKVKSSIVFIAVFKYLQEEAVRYFKRNKITKAIWKEVKKSEIQWIITVPAIWNDEAKFRMKKWIIEAGLVIKNISDQCLIRYEPDCASLCVQHKIHKSGFNGFSDVKFIKNDRYILVDAGGGTVDIACHHILGDLNKFQVKEILPPSGGPWGSCYIDDEYAKLLQEIFGEETLNAFKAKKENAGKYLKLFHDFQIAKEEFDPNRNDQSHRVKLGFDFIVFIQDKLEENENDNFDDIEDIVSAYNKYGESKIELEDEYLSMNVIVWKSMFNHIIDPIIQHIKNLLSTPQLKENCNYLCLVGGLSQSPYFQERMNEEFGLKSSYKLPIFTPDKPILSVVEGAAHFGNTEYVDYIKARILRCTYGEIVQLPESKAIARGIPKAYIEKNKIWDIYEKQWWVHDCFDVLARKYDEINIGDERISVGERSDANQLKMNVRLARSNSMDPKVRSDGYDLGIVEVEFPNNDEDDMKATLKFHFAENIIKAVVCRDKHPQHEEILEIEFDT